MTATLIQQPLDNGYRFGVHWMPSTLSDCFSELSV